MTGRTVRHILNATLRDVQVKAGAQIPRYWTGWAEVEVWTITSFLVVI